MKFGAIRSEFKSPLYKLVEIFQSGRDNWKSKFQELKSECKRLKNQAAADRKSRESWRSKYFSLREEVAELKAKKNR